MDERLDSTENFALTIATALASLYDKKNDLGMRINRTPIIEGALERLRTISQERTEGLTKFYQELIVV